MSNQEEEPLDPAVEAIRVKMVRLLAISGGIMMLGLMAVLFGIVYKINQPDVAEPTAPVVGSDRVLTIPRGAKVINATQSDRLVTLMLTLQDGSKKVHVYNGSGVLIASYLIREE